MTIPNQDVLDIALKLPATERFAVVEELLKSLDKPDPELDRMWAVEAEKRLAAYRSGKLRGVPMNDVFPA